MRRRSLSSWVILALLVALAAAALAACGGSSSSSSSSPAATAVAGAPSADQIVKDSEAKMAQVKSASFTADMGFEVQGDTSKMTDPTSKALLSQGITLHAEGKSASQPVAVDMKMALGIGGQNLELGMMSQGTKSWVEYKNQWYKVDGKSGKSLDKQVGVGAAPTEQLKSLGLDPSAWGTSYTLVGTENLNGTQVYHVKATADPQKLADALLKMSKDPSLAQKLGGSGQLKQLEQGLQQNSKQAQELQKSLKDVTVDYWIGVDDQLMHKAQFAAALDTKGQQGMTGVDGMTMKVAVTMADFDQPVSVTPPANALPMSKLTQQMFGAMGSTSGLTY